MADLRDLQEQASILKEISQSYAWEVLVAKAKAKAIALQTEIVQGRCKSFEEYQKACSFIAGMDYVINIPDHLQETLKLAMENDSA